MENWSDRVSFSILVQDTSDSPAEGFSIARMSIGLSLHRELWLGLSRIALRLIVESL